MVGIKGVYRFIVVFDALVLLLGFLHPLDVSNSNPGLFFGLVALAMTGVVLSVVAYIGLLLLKSWGYFIYVIVFLINGILFLALPTYPLVHFLIMGLILGLPLVDKTLKKAFFW